jgi:hypothetical protein
MVEIDSRAVLMLARLDARIETASPFPLIDIDRATRASRDGAGVDVTIIDVPAVLTFGIAAAG